MKGMCQCCGEVPVAPADINAEANANGLCVNCLRLIKAGLDQLGIKLVSRPAGNQAKAGK